MRVWQWSQSLHTTPKKTLLYREYGSIIISNNSTKIESNVTTGRQTKIDCFSVDGIWNHCNNVFEALLCYYHYCPCQKARPFPTDFKIERVVETRQQDQMRSDYIRQKDTASLRCGSVSAGFPEKLMHQSKAISKKTFWTNVLPVKSVLQQIFDGKLFGYVEYLTRYFWNFPLIIKKTVFIKDDMGALMREYAEEQYGSTQKNVRIKPPLNQWNAHQPFTFVSLEAWVDVQEIS